MLKTLIFTGLTFLATAQSFAVKSPKKPQNPIIKIDTKVKGNDDDNDLPSPGLSPITQVHNHTNLDNLFAEDDKNSSEEERKALERVLTLAFQCFVMGSDSK